MLIMLPPSEAKSAPSRGRPLRMESLTFPELHGTRAAVLDALIDLCTSDRPGDLDEATRQLGAGKTLSEEVARNACLTTAPTARADTIYTGVLYEALDLGALEGSAKRRATRWVAIVSGLFGMVRPNDRIPAYRLSGDVTLPGVGNLAAAWRRAMSDAVHEAAGPGLVVDLRSSTYAGFWRPDAALARRTVTVRVLHEVNGKRKVVSHFNKATKGRIVRALLEDGANPARPARFADHLVALGWKVELGDTTRQGTELDVVVTDL